MAIDLDLGILTPRALSSPNDGSAFLKLLNTLMPEFQPEYYGYYEPLKNRFDPQNPEKALDAWKSTFLWKRKKPRVDGSMWTSDPQNHSAIFISSDSRSVQEVDLINFFQKLSNQVNADFAYVHLFTDDEFKTYGNEIVQPFRRGITTHELRKYLPNLCWGTIFGRNYINLFGAERILSCPAFMVRQLTGDLIYIQLSESILDLKSKYLEVDAVRFSVKEHLNCNAFYDPIVGGSHRYTTPDFSLETVP